MECECVNEWPLALSLRFASLFRKRRFTLRRTLKRLEDWRERFIGKGNGEQRVRCFCSVFEDLKIGNGDVLPPVD